jgi:hypothetical protein
MNLDTTTKPLYSGFGCNIGLQDSDWGYMSHQITISDELFERLKRLAEPFVDREPEDVIWNLVNRKESDSAGYDARDKSDARLSASLQESVSPISRVPRERGTTVQIGDNKIDAVSVRALYGQALKLFVERHSSKLKAVVPLKTSGQRYLIALKPVHPSGTPFVKPVEFGGFHMEAHKDYKNGIAHLRILCSRLGLPLKYLR